MGAGSRSTPTSVRSSQLLTCLCLFLVFFPTLIYGEEGVEGRRRMEGGVGWKKWV